METGAQNGLPLPVGFPNRLYIGHLGQNLAGGGIGEATGDEAAAEQTARIENEIAIGVNGKEVDGAVFPPGIIVEVGLRLHPAHVSHMLCSAYRTKFTSTARVCKAAKPANRHCLTVVVAARRQ